MSIQIIVNGEPRAYPEGYTILQVLKDLSLDPERVAVELDRRLVKQAHWQSTVLHDGSKLEIVQFVGGG